jgi:predicted ATPase
MHFEKFQKFVLTGSKGSGKKMLLKYLCQKQNLNYFEKDCDQIYSL